mgnify:FL=1
MCWYVLLFKGFKESKERDVIIEIISNIYGVNLEMS